MTPSRRIAKGVTALAVLVALVVGVPWLLVAGVGWPVPDHVPSTGELEAFITAPISTRLLVNGVAIIGWAVWGWFMWTLVTESIAALAGRTPRGAGRVGWARLGAAALIAAVVAVFVATASHAAPTHQTVATAELDDEATAHSPRPASTHAVGDLTVHTVEPDDNLSSIAGNYMHDENEWTQIYSENKGKPQSGGGALTDPDFIKPGWKLAIPQTGTDEGTDDSDDARAGTDGSGSAPDKGKPPPSASSAPESPSSTTSSQASHGDNVRQHQDSSDDGGINTVVLAVGTVVSLGFVAALVAIVRAARRRIRDYTTSTADQPDLEVGLPGKLAALEGLTHHDLPNNDEPPALGIDAEAHPVLLAEAARGGLGLAGPGAEATARAAITTALAADDQDAHSQGIDILTTTDTLDRLSDHAGLTTVDLHRLWHHSTTERLMTTLSREVIARTRAAANDPESRDTNTTSVGDPSTMGPVIAVIDPGTCDTEVLTALLQQGAPLGVGALILGAWPRRTLHIAPDCGTDDTAPTTCHTMDADTFTATLSTLTQVARTLEEPITKPRIPDEYFDDDHELPPLDANAKAPVQPNIDAEPESVVCRDTSEAPLVPSPSGYDDPLERHVNANRETPACKDPIGPDALLATGDAAPTSSSGSRFGQAIPGTLRSESTHRDDTDHQRPSQYTTNEKPKTARPTATSTRQAQQVQLPSMTNSPPQPTPAPETAGAHYEVADQTPVPSNSVTSTEIDGSSTESATAIVRLKVFGNVETNVNGQPVHFTRAKGRELLALLATQPQGLSTETVTEYIVGETHVKKARSHLASIVTSTRGDLRKATNADRSTMFIGYTNNHYRLDTQLVASDLAEFDEHLNAAGSTSDSYERTSHLVQALSVYIGEYSADVTDDTWPESIRTTYRAQACEAALTIASYWADNGDASKAIDTLERATTIDPYNEVAYARLMQAHITADAPDAARKTFDRLRSRLAKIDSKPSPELTTLLSSCERTVA